MRKWKTKLLGDNHMNFYGWCIAGLLVIGASFWYVIRAIRAGASSTPDGILLMAIYFVLLGQFGIGLHNYTARVAEKLDADDKPRAEKNHGA
jgi:hypothetical protein